MKITLKLEDAPETSRLREVASRLRNTLPLMKSWGIETGKAAKKSALSRGGRDFWPRVARSIEMRAVTERSAEVAASEPGAALHQFGGEIRPVRKKALTIPISEEARGKSVADFAARQLFAIGGDGNDSLGVLGYADGEQQFHPLFALRTRAVVPADPWWPEDEELLAIADREAAYWLRRQEEK